MWVLWSIRQSRNVVCCWLRHSSVGDSWHFGADPDPYFWLMDLDPTPFFFDIKNAKKIFCFHIFSHNLLTGFRLKINFLLQFCVKILFCRHYFSPLNTFMRKEIRTSGLWIRIREAQKHADPSDPVPDPQHCGILPAGGIHFLESIPGLHKHLKIRASQKQHRRDMWGPSCRKFFLAVNFVLRRRYFLIVFNEYYFFFMVGPGSVRQSVLELMSRAPGFLAVVWFGASPTLFPPSIALPATHRKTEKERQFADGRGGLEPNRTMAKKAGSSTNPSILSGCN